MDLQRFTFLFKSLKNTRDIDFSVTLYYFRDWMAYQSSLQKRDKLLNFDFLIELQYTFEVDAETSSTSSKRVYLVENGKKVHETTARFNLTDKNDTKCLNFSQIYVEVCTRIFIPLSNYCTLCSIFVIWTSVDTIFEHSAVFQHLLLEILSKRHVVKHGLDSIISKTWTWLVKHGLYIGLD